MDKQFLRRVIKHRPVDLHNVGAADNVGHLDYYGEKIYSISDYRKWLKIQRDFKITGKLPHRLGA